VFKFASNMAREEREASAGGDPARSRFEGAVTGGRCDTQSCTRRETFGFETRLWVLRDAGFVVIMIVGEEVYGVEGR
jgi:hypothetical protein